MKLLTGREVYRLSIDQTPQQTKASEKSPSRTYYRAKYDGIGFTVDQHFMDAFTKGSVAEITLSEGTREINDPLNVGQKKTINSLAFGSYATKEQILNAAKFDKELAVIDNPTLDNIVLNDEQFNKLQLALKAGV